MAAPFPIKLEVERGETLEDRAFTFTNPDGTLPLEAPITSARLVIRKDTGEIVLDISDTDTEDKLVIDNDLGLVTAIVDSDTTFGIAAGVCPTELWCDFDGIPTPKHPTHSGVTIFTDPIGLRPGT